MQLNVINQQRKIATDGKLKNCVSLKNGYL